MTTPASDYICTMQYKRLSHGCFYISPYITSER